MSIPYGFCYCGCGERTRVPAETSRREGQIKGVPLRFIHGHNARRSEPDYIVDENGCWIWQLAISKYGYGVRTWGSGTNQAHRQYYERFVGPIPEGLHIDHLCRVKACVNPAHLEPVTLAENNRRKALAQTHCVHGHAFDQINTYIHPTSGSRGCRACRRASEQKYNARRRAMRQAERSAA